jgi:DNA invertase Pin-like site-specific DNA recombinase
MSKRSPDHEQEAGASNGSPGSHLRNWRPGDDDADELLRQKIADALRDGASERQLAKVLGISRMQLWRAQKFNAIPEDLFDQLMKARPR